MGNLSKWLIAVPFISLWTLGLPALIAGRLDWFLAAPWDVVFVLLWVGAFAAGTHFYQPARHRRRPGRTRLVFSLATLVVPLLAIYERTHGPAGSRSPLWAAVGLGLFLLGAALGVAAWRALGRWYAPDPDVRPGQRLITSGPYRLVRHPMYTALLLALLMKGVVGEEGHVAGIDLAPKMVARARRQAQKRGLEMDFRVASIADLPFPDDSFDVAISSLMAHHLPRRIKQAGFAEVCRVLRPGGHFLLCDFGPPPERWMWMTPLLMRLLSRAGEHPEDNLEWRIPTMLEEAGFGTPETIAHFDFLAGTLRIYFVRATMPPKETS